MCPTIMIHSIIATIVEISTTVLELIGRLIPIVAVVIIGLVVGVSVASTVVGRIGTRSSVILMVSMITLVRMVQEGLRWVVVHVVIERLIRHMVRRMWNGVLRVSNWRHQWNLIKCLLNIITLIHWRIWGSELIS